MIKVDLNITRRELGRMHSGARCANHAIDRALNTGQPDLEVRNRLLSIKSHIRTALGQVEDARAIIHELENGDYGL